MKNVAILIIAMGVFFCYSNGCPGRTCPSDDFSLHSFDSHLLTDTYYAEGANFGDFNGDGQNDAVYGPFWYEGPDFINKHEIYKPVAQNLNGYADNFFVWPFDFNGDQHTDILVVGLPGTPAYIYINPGAADPQQHWEKQEAINYVGNESPQFVNLVGDPQPELVCTHDGYFGYATFDRDHPHQPWTFRKISQQIGGSQFEHGMGVGDIDGDGKLDILAKNGWLQQPKSLTGEPEWSFHPFEFAADGGADMFAYDVDGDGDNDVITSLSAHGNGLAWYEQISADGKISFLKHLIMGRRPDENNYGVVFSELHSVRLTDINGDGLKDIVTGKTFRSHHEQVPDWDAPPVVYWFELVRNSDGVDWVPHLIGNESGIGRQLTVGDINSDGLPDIIVGGMKGAHVLIHAKVAVDEGTRKAAQPRPTPELKSGLTPEQAASHMTSLPGFNIQLAAGEPQVHQPVGFTIDHRGRLWVAEAYNYPMRAPAGEGLDKIVILEDTNQDGTLDSRKVFIEGLNLVSGIEVGFGGVWVGAAPYLMFIPDADEDDVPDAEPQILLDGFGYEDTHETLNSFIWGPDGWLYGCHGIFTHSKVGPPGTPDNQRTPLNASVWRYHPTRHVFEVFSHGISNQWGVDFNDYGQSFVTACVIPHLWHVIQGGKYQRQAGQHFNPYTFDDLKTIADHQHYVGNIADHAWWGHENPAPADTLSSGGGHAHCGAMIYLGDNWPDEFRNRIFMNNIHGNRVNQDILERKGSGYVGHHGDDILLANDQWYRGINLKYGPNGSVYLIDWYDKNACHRSQPEIWDRTNGRIYNLAYGNPPKIAVDLGKKSDAQLVELQQHPNEWFVRMARRILQQRAATGKLDKQTHPALVEMFHQQSDVPKKLRTLWALHVTDGLTDALRRALLADPNESIRSWAIQLELEDRKISDSVASQLVELAKKDQSPVVRLYLASAAQRMRPAERWPFIEAFAQHAEDANDHNLPLMYWYAMEPLVLQDTPRALTLAGSSQLSLLTQYIVRRASADHQGLNAVANAIEQSNDPTIQLTYLDQMLIAFAGRANLSAPEAWDSAYEKLAASDNVEVNERADQVAVIFGDARVFPKLRAVASDVHATSEKRTQAIDILVRSGDEESAKTFQSLLNEPELRGLAIRALSRLSDPNTPEMLLQIYKNLPAAEQRDAIATLTSRPAYANQLLDAIHSKTIPGTDLHAFNVRQLLQFNNEKLNEKIKSVWGEVREASVDAKALIDEYKSKLTADVLAEADVHNGRRIYDTTCASCHTLFGSGGKVGPDITGSNRADLNYILENVLAPSAVLGNEYRMTVVLTLDGRQVSGILQNESDSAITLRTINDTVVIAKDDIDERKLSDLSMMPIGQLDTLQPDEIRDLIAYIAVPSQVAPRGPRSTINAETNRVDDAIEGETMKIIGQPAGAVGNQAMTGFPNDHWSGNQQLWWQGAKPGEKLVLEFDVPDDGTYDLELVATKALDYGIVQLSLNNQALGSELDLFNPQGVVTTGVLSFPDLKLKQGASRLSIEIIGANPQAVKSYMFGLDYVRLVPSQKTKP